MKKLAVVYWSGTGNTEAMAEALAKAARSGGASADVYQVSSFNAGMVDNYEALAFGCPAMGAEELEDSEFAPVFNDCLPKLAGKAVGLIGSYGWGGGEWMSNWQDMCAEAGVALVSDGVVANEAPDDEAMANLAALAAALA